MKKLKSYYLIMFVLCLFNAKAQNNDENGRLSLSSWIPETIEDLPSSAKTNLENKLSQIVTANGVSGDIANSRFIISANVNVLSKNITPTAPIMQAYTLDITFYIGDGFEGKAFSSYNTTVKGVGENETKAYLSAIKNIKTNNPAFQSFVEKGKTKIIAYYNSQCDFIIRNAKTKANMNQFDEAIWDLTSIPDVCSECWSKALDVTSQIFKQKIDFDCKLKINQASSIWSASQSWEAANQAGQILSTIDPNASCVNEIKILTDRIAKRILEIDKREWDYKYDYNISLKRDMIKAYRDIGVAWGKGQPQNVTYKSLW